MPVFFRPRRIERRRRSGRRPLVQELERRSLLATFTVTVATDMNTTTGDPGSMRHAINDSNMTPGLNTINFDIPGTGVQTIKLGAALPQITVPATINGYSQPGSQPNTLTTGDNAVLLIVLDGTNVGPGGAGLNIAAGNSAVQGLVIANCPGDGIQLQTAGGDVIAGNFIGVAATGTTAASNGLNGVSIDSGTGDTIGGSAPADRNVISDNHEAGVNIGGLLPNPSGADNNFVQGNYIGTDLSGTQPLGNNNGVNVSKASGNLIADNVISANAGTGINLVSGASFNVVQGNLIGTDVTGAHPLANGVGVGVTGPSNRIGGTTFAAENVIAGNTHDGISIDDTAPGQNLVQGNFIGTNAGGIALGNGGDGIFLEGGGDTVGGPAAGDGNTITNNGAAGVEVAGTASSETILSNLVFSNHTGEILLDPGANNDQAAPVIGAAASSAGGTAVRGTIDSTPFTTVILQFFASPSLDSAGQAQGERFLGAETLVTDSSGSASFSITVGSALLAGPYITSTATADPAGNTSEFSTAVQLGAPLTLADPGFEIASVTSGPTAYVYDPTGSPWDFIGKAGIAGNGSAFTSGNPDAPQGSQVMFLQRTGSVSQSINLAAGTYVVSLEAAQRGNHNNGGQTINVLVDGNPVTMITPVGTSYAAYSTSSFTVTAGNHTINLAGLNPLGGDNTAFIDDISVTAPPTVADPGFETPVVGSGLTAYVYAPAGSPWTFTGQAGVSGNGSAFTSGNPDAPQGGQVAFTQNTSAISQSVNLAAGTYVLSLEAAQRANQNNGGQAFNVLVDGKLIATITPASASYSSYSTSAFTVAAGVHIIALSGLNPHLGDNTAFIDDISIAAASPINDPGFEGFSFGTATKMFVYAPAATATQPWTFTGAAGVSQNGSGFTSGNPSAPQGSQVAFVQNAGAISQSVNLTAGTYVLTLEAAQRANIAQSGQEIEILVNGNPVGTVKPAGTSYASYSTNAFSVPAGSNTITLAGLNPNGGDNTALVDDVLIAAPSAFADPGFEMSSVGSGFSAYVYGPTNSPWTFSGDAGVTGNASAFTSGNPDAPQEGQVAFVQRTGTLSEVVDLAFGTYVLTFDAAQRGNQNQGGEGLQVFIDNNPTPVSTIIPVGPSYASYSTSAFTLSAGNHTIKLVGYDPNGGDNTAFIDDMSLDAPSLVADPGFETVQVGSGLTGYRYNPTGSPWVFVGKAGLSGNGSAFTSGNPGAPQGGQVAFVQNSGSISQQVNLAAGTYVLTFDAAQRGNVGQSGQEVAVLVDGTVVGTVKPAGTSYASYSTSAFTVAAGSHSIAFAGLNPLGGDNTAFIDNISITAPPVLGDPGFEAQSVGTGYVYDPAGTPWTFSGLAGVAGNGSTLTSGSPAAPQGGQVAFVQGTGSISQSANLAAGTYFLTFDAAQRATSNQGGQAIQVFVDGTLEGVITPVGVFYAVYDSREFTLAAGSHTVTFVGLNPLGGNNTALIDDVTIKST
jgi:hypothetical protein